jgi:hypothetical protein
MQILLAVFLSLDAAGTEVAQPTPERSLSPADGSNTASAAGANTAVTNAAPTGAATTNTETTSAPSLQPKASPPGPDLSALSREELEARVKSLTQDLASANAEAESFREQWQDLKLRDEALGVDALTVDDQKLEDRLTAAVGELYRSEMKRREALQLLGKLLDTTQQLLATAPKEDPETRANYEVASRAAKDYLAGGGGTAIPLGTALDDGRIADLNPELNAVVLNLGKSQGVKEGMPFLIYHDSVEIGTVKVVLARDLVSAAVVESVKPNAALKVGDRAAVDARQ